MAPVAARAPMALVAALLVVRLADESVGFLREGAFESWRVDLGLSYRAAATVLVMAAPGSIAGSAFSALADYRSRRAIAAGGAFAYGLSLLGFALARTTVELGAASFVLGVGATAMVHACEVALVDVVGDDLDRAVGATSLFGALGDLAGPLVIVVAAALGWSWRVPFIVAAALCALYGAWLLTLPMPPPAPPAADHRGAGRETLALLRDPAIWCFGIVAMLLVQIDEAYLAFVIAFLRRDTHLSTALATTVGASIVVGGLVGYARAARGNRHDDRARTLRAAAAGLTVAAVGIAAVPSTVAVIGFGLAFGFANARFWVVFHAIVLRHRPGRTGSVSAVVGNLEMLGFAFPIAIGAIADAHGLRAGLLAYAVVPALLFVSAGTIARVATVRDRGRA